MELGGLGQGLVDCVVLCLGGGGYVVVLGGVCSGVLKKKGGGGERLQKSTDFGCVVIFYRQNASIRFDSVSCNFSFVPASHPNTSQPS